MTTPDPIAMTAAVEGVLDDLHDAAAQADGERYFAHFTEDGIFIGTDPSERWTVEDFRAYAAPYFDAGRGWTYRALERHVTIGPGGEVAWFDERLENAKYGIVRGSGALVRQQGSWKLAQYNLAFEVPNELSGALLELIEKARPAAQ